MAPTRRGFPVPLLVVFSFLAVFGSCQTAPAAPSSSLPTAIADTQTVAAPTATPAPPLTSIPTHAPSPRPASPSPSPTPEELGLARYFPEPWPGVLPQWMYEPPADRLVSTSESWPVSCTVRLQNQNGNPLATFSQDECNCGPCHLLWSRSKERAVVAIEPATSTVMRFLLIDHNGRQLGDMAYAYYDPVWSPTKDVLAYQGSTSVQDRLFIVDADGDPLAIGEPLAPRTCQACGTLPRWLAGGWLEVDNPARKSRRHVWRRAKPGAKHIIGGISAVCWRNNGGAVLYQYGAGIRHEQVAVVLEIEMWR
jgi:hypothetical protein